MLVTRKRYTRLFVTLLMAAGALAGTSGCQNCCTNVPTVADAAGSGSDWVFLWIAAYRDTWMDQSAPNPGAGCDTELRFGQFLESVRRGYLDFMLPQLPAGSQITEAYLNLYHPARRGDGTTDDINVNVQRVTDGWEACPQTIATSFSPGGDFNIDLRSQDWSGSENISLLINNILANPTGFEGFALHYLSGGGNPVQKSFYSNNHRSRTSVALGLAPRLLLRVRLPSGASSSSIGLPGIPSNNDLGDVSRRPGAPGFLAFLTPSSPNVLMMQVAQGTSTGPWPVGWNVAIAGVP